MWAPETSRKEIEEKLGKMGDYVKIGYLTTCLKNQLDFDTKRFVLLSLASLYESKKMFSDAGKSMRQASDISTTDQSKVGDFLKASELFIKGGNYDEAELTFKKAMSIANTKQKDELKNSVKGYYLAQSNSYLKKDKRKQAAEIYERMLSMDLNSVEKNEIQKKLLALYENLGKIREYYVLKQRIEGNIITNVKNKNEKKF